MAKNRKLKKQVIKSLVDITKEKYKDYELYLDNDFYKNLKNNLVIYYDKKSYINPEIYLKVIIDNLVMERLANYCENDIDLQILLIDKFSTVVKTVMRKLNYSENEITDKYDELIINMVANYLNEENFYIHIGKYLIENKNKILTKI